MRKFVGGAVLLLIAVYLLRGGDAMGLLTLVQSMLTDLAEVGHGLAARVVTSRG